MHSDNNLKLTKYHWNINKTYRKAHVIEHIYKQFNYDIVTLRSERLFILVEYIGDMVHIMTLLVWVLRSWSLIGWSQLHSMRIYQVLLEFLAL